MPLYWQLDAVFGDNETLFRAGVRALDLHQMLDMYPTKTSHLKQTCKGSPYSWLFPLAWPDFVDFVPGSELSRPVTNPRDAERQECASQEFPSTSVEQPVIRCSLRANAIPKTASPGGARGELSQIRFDI